MDHHLSTPDPIFSEASGPRPLFSTPKTLLYNHPDTTPKAYLTSMHIQETVFPQFLAAEFITLVLLSRLFAKVRTSSYVPHSIRAPWYPAALSVWNIESTDLTVEMLT